ncbi:prohibitin family protein [Candidatus Nitrosocosmicus agrestis]|jgi:regulator of protease activity HflC (stomatin/prohibitin superfamily)|uniref:prohibitin family protein n=1 Tax=Candidatus Nitrosocosmicus agrestis TaxID=2563600 RepID=UPI00122E0B4C|nr:prohibitin family protein [Candidatus Nitrosocosmicus sp. SS]KAA2280823.1 prohibitin family protein [Candidatus Nitrosocosmicus sp. SS]KAF0868908.1 prohibitin family protein [Candidatus Nitrosocosmicus sp. SS]
MVDFFKSKRNRRITPDGEPLEDVGGGGGFGFSSPLKIAIPAIIAVIIIFVVLTSSLKIVEAGNRGVLLKFGAVDTSVSLSEGLHFVLPFRDSIVPMEVRTQKIVESTTSASKDLQNVATEVALNYRINPDTVPILYKEIGLDYSNRVIVPTIQESVKQVTARYNAEELITKRDQVKSEIEEQIEARLTPYNIIMDTISITDFQFSDQFVQAVEAKVQAEQRALQAQNELRRIQIEAQQTEAKALGDQKANIASAEGQRQANILKAQGESEAIKIIDTQLRNSTEYLNWLQAQRWDGKLPLVTGSSGGAGANNLGAIPFIEIPLGGSTSNSESPARTTNTPPSNSSTLPSGQAPPLPTTS